MMDGSTFFVYVNSLRAENKTYQNMATAEEFEELLGRYEIEQDPQKKAEILEKMRTNVLERNGNNDMFKNMSIRISQAGLRELIEISRSMEAIRKQKQREVINDEARKNHTGRNKYCKDHPYTNFNNSKK